MGCELLYMYMNLETKNPNEILTNHVQKYLKQMHSDRFKPKPKNGSTPENPPEWRIRRIFWCWTILGFGVKPDFAPVHLL